jgi:hypothetical protein
VLEKELEALGKEFEKEPEVLGKELEVLENEPEALGKELGADKGVPIGRGVPKGRAVLGREEKVGKVEALPSVEAEENEGKAEELEKLACKRAHSAWEMGPVGIEKPPEKEDNGAEAGGKETGG